MAKHRSDEGSNSDSSSGSLKEITADDFKQQDARGPAPRSRVWMGDHLMGYPPAVHRNYCQDLYSFAWSQAVQNKPLGFDVKPAEVDDDEEIEMYDVEENEGDGRGDKEEGELEEGEIEFGSEPASNEPVNVESSEERTEEKEKVDKVLDLEERDEEIGEFDKRFGVILEELETITVEEAESSFEEVCSRLQKCFASLKQMHSEGLEGHGPVLDVLVQQAFMGIQTVYSAFNSGNLKNMDQNKELLLRLLIHIKNQYSGFLTSEHVKEIDVRVHALASEAVSVGKTSGNVNGSSNIAERPEISKERLRLDPIGSMSVSGKASLSKLEVPTSRSRVDFSPLLNLHADYDEDSLPSPTRDNAPPLPVLKPIGFGIGVAPPAQPASSKNVKSENGTSHPYVTDPFQAVSSYQQKYGKNSTIVFNRLPSPTPSEDGNNGGDDIYGEVSSSSVPANTGTVGPSSSTVYTNSSGRPQMALVNSSVGFKIAPFNSSGGLQMSSVNSSGGPQMSSVNSSGGLQMSSVNSSGGSQMAPLNTSGGSQMAPLNSSGGGGQMALVKASAKSRDPRLRFMNSEVGGAPQIGLAAGSVNSRKHKAIDEPVPDEYNLKRQRNGSTSSRDAQVTAGRGGWIEDNGMVASQMNNRVQPNKNMAIGNRNLVGGEVGPDRRLVNDNNNLNGLNGGSAPNMSTSTAPVVSLPSLLKDIAVNPTMLVELIKMEQQKIAAAEAQKKAAGSAVNGLSSAISPSLDVGQNPAAKPQMAPQNTKMNGPNDMGKIRMKPRDPRRVLHSNMVQKSESLGFELAKNNGNLPSEMQSSKDRLTVQEQGEKSQTNTLPSQSASLPDISQQFTKSLQSIADIVSSSQASVPPVGTQNSSQLPSKISNDTTELKTVTGMCTQGETTSGASDSANSWGDVDHLLDGYDDQQKAAIQKERARRIEEQNKMFAERKLCLVLDLDHTLLNSAKFVEVDPIHEEILRQKEQEDRQRQERHLFRFPHMGMWTKLRPGVWNFLEKASKLYELHLYTMGNKLYATEMAKVLDPKGTLFRGRVISKGDEGDPFDGDDRAPKSKDLDGVLGMESAVVIIDDSLRVWPHNKHNLIVVERYMYFPSSRRQFGLSGPSLLEIDHDERPDAGTLASSLGVIERLHQIFFSHQSLNEVDVRNILAAEQRKILAGCKIVFSRVFPVGEANPYLHPLWQTAEQFGAECTNQIDEHVTHVVANSFGTDKVNWALSTGRFVVHPGWVEASALLYRRANEQDFAIKG